VSSVRDFQPGDEVAIRPVMEAALDADRMPGWTQANVDNALDRLAVDPTGVLIAEEDGRPVGYWADRFDDLSVHPAHRRRGHGRRLLEAATVRAGDRGQDRLVLHVPPHLPGSVAFAIAMGLTYQSSLWLFRLAPDRPMPPAELGPELVTRPWAPDEDVEAFAAFANAAWEGHPSSLGLDARLARHVAELPGFDPAGICIVARREAPGEPIAFAKVELRPTEGERPTGWIGQIAVLPAHRGTGLGRMLLRWSVGYLRSRGAGTLELAVEAANDRALGLYRRAGFEPAVEWPHWTRPTARAAAQPEAVLAGSAGESGRAPA
jgi:mycothiol synthase